MRRGLGAGRRGRGRATWPVAFATLVAAATMAGAVHAAPDPHVTVTDAREIVDVEVRGPEKRGAFRPAAWRTLSSIAIAPGAYELRLRVDVDGAADALELPHCAGRGAVRVDGRGTQLAPGPHVVRLSPGRHEVLVEVRVSAYERRVACGGPPRIGRAVSAREGLGVLSFASPEAAKGGGRAVVYLPRNHDDTRPAVVLVGLHPWNGDPWTYTAYEELLRAAEAKDVVLLFPSGLGNSLYTASAEEEVLRALDALSRAIAVDPRAVSLWGASMGGAGATTIGFHHPDRFATITSFFGDSKYDLSTYVRAILPNEAAAHAVNALDVVENARHVPVWLVHGEDDRTSPIAQSAMLDRALRDRGFSVRFDRVPGVGHEGRLVARYLAEVVERALRARVPDVRRVTYRSVRPSDLGAYGVTLVRSSNVGDAFVDVEHAADGKVHVRRAEGLRAIRIARGALQTVLEGPPPEIVVDDPKAAVDVRWGP